MLREPLSLGWDGPSSWMMLDAWESAGNRGEGLDGVHKTFGSLLAQKQLEMLGWWKVDSTCIEAAGSVVSWAGEAECDHFWFSSES